MKKKKKNFCIIFCDNKHLYQNLGRFCCPFWFIPALYKEQERDLWSYDNQLMDFCLLLSDLSELTITPWTPYNITHLSPLISTPEHWRQSSSRLCIHSLLTNCLLEGKFHPRHSKTQSWRNGNSLLIHYITCTCRHLSIFKNLYISATEKQSPNLRQAYMIAWSKNFYVTVTLTQISWFNSLSLSRFITSQYLFLKRVFSFYKPNMHILVLTTDILIN